MSDDAKAMMAKKVAGLARDAFLGGHEAGLSVARQVIEMVREMRSVPLDMRLDACEELVRRCAVAAPKQCPSAETIAAGMLSNERAN